jgi:deoxyribonuclease-4
MELRKLKYDGGAHIGFQKYIYKTLSEAVKKHMFSVQFFLGNPYQINRAAIEDYDYRMCARITKRFPINIYTHFPYIANLAGKSQKNSLAWSGNSKVDNYLRVVIKQIEYEMGCVAKLGGKGVVIHPGSYPDREDGLNAIIKTLNKIKFDENHSLLLENCAAEGNKLCKDFNEIAKVLDGADNKTNIGVCLDTAHVWGAGIYDISTIEGVDLMFSEFESIIGIDKLKLIHLNDSSVEFGSRKDRHAEISTGCIWKDKVDVFYHLIDVAKSKNIPFILESDGSDIVFFLDVCSPCNQNYNYC